MLTGPSARRETRRLRSVGIGLPGRSDMKAKATPEGYHTLTPILRVPDAAAALDFYKRAFGASEDFRRERHGELLLAVT